MDKFEVGKTYRHNTSKREYEVLWVGNELTVLKRLEPDTKEFSISKWDRGNYTEVKPKEVSYLVWYEDKIGKMVLAYKDIKTFQTGVAKAGIKAIKKVEIEEGEGLELLNEE